MNETQMRAMVFNAERVAESATAVAARAVAHAELITADSIAASSELRRLRTVIARALKVARLCRDGSANETIIALLSGQEVPEEWFDREP